jgi:drug/metabolite transporter (DMT)-like permease
MLGPLLVLLARGEQIVLLPAGLRWRLCWIATLSTVAFIAFNVGTQVANTAIVAPLSSLSSAVTVLLAWLLLRDRLALWQWVGVAIILSGVVLVSM